MSKTKHTPSGMTKEAEKMWAEAEFERWFRGKFGRWNPRLWLRGVCLDAWMMAEKRQEEEIERLREDLKDAREAARTCWKIIYDAGKNPISDDDCTALSGRWFWLEATED